MIKSIKKTASLLLCLMLSIVAGCADKEKSEEETTYLKVVLGGEGEMRDSQEVWNLFNDKLDAFLPNTQVEFEIIPMADYGEKWMRIAAARETVDVMWFGWMLSLSDEIHRGSIQPIDDYLKYVPDLTKEIPPWIMDLGKDNTTQYLVPIAQMMTTIPYGVFTQESLAQKYGIDAETITKNFSKKEMITRKDFEPFEDYLEKLKAAGELRKGVSQGFISTIASKIGGLGQYKQNIVANTCIDWSSDDLKVYDRLDDFPHDIEFYEMIRDWYEKGYIRKDILTVQDPQKDQGKENGYVLWTESCFKGAAQRASKSYGINVMGIHVYDEIFVPNTTPTTNLAIPSTAKDGVLSMKFIELMNTKKGAELYNLYLYGIEGKHYKKITDTDIEWLEPKLPGSSFENAYGYYPWSIGNVFNAYMTQYDIPGWNDYIKEEVNGKARRSPLMGFTLDTTPIRLELAQYKAIEKEYEYVQFGANANFRELLKERKAKMKQAGSDKILKEVTRQVNAWKEGNKENN